MIFARSYALGMCWNMFYPTYEFWKPALFLNLWLDTWCTIKILGGRRGEQRWRHPLYPCSHEQRLSLPTPYFKMFLERFFKNSHSSPPHLTTSFAVTPFPIPHPCPHPIKSLIAHSLLFLAYCKEIYYRLYTERRAASETSIEFVLLSF